ncbi:hypothetical protein M2119_000518 [Aurantimicrobium minutum]|uniref:hypothetical protein n=1 Tax=Aurantimicrobium minutum TaxID=708131 RepID=UPI0024739357|nr:hypothetical protein [Aurantimicrobium minutum]MDH6532281.1 hypothetical protein [Aurantimicrobium minutum]
MSTENEEGQRPGLSDPLFDEELDAFKFRNSMRKRPEYQTEYSHYSGLNSEDFYAKIRSQNLRRSSQFAASLLQAETTELPPATAPKSHQSTKAYARNPFGAHVARVLATLVLVGTVAILGLSSTTFALSLVALVLAGSFGALSLYFDRAPKNKP